MFAAGNPRQRNAMSTQKTLKIVPRRQTINARFHEQGLPKSVVLCSFDKLDRLIAKHDKTSKIGLTRGREVCRREHTEASFTTHEILLHERVWNDLESLREKLREELSAVPETRKPSPVLTVNGLIDEYLSVSVARGLADDTCKHQRHQLKHLRRFAGTLRLDQINRRSLDAEFVASLRARGLSDSYLHQIHRISHVFWNWVVSAEYLEIPLLRQRVQRPAPVSKPLSVSEVQNILAHVALEPRDTQRCVYFLRYTGCRRSEVYNLKLSDIVLDPPAPLRPHCLLGTTQSTKTGGRNVVRTLANPHLLEFLRRDIAARGADEVWYLDNGTGNRAWSNSDGVSRVVGKFLSRLGISGRQSCHTFRHTVGIELLEAEVDLKTVSEYLGHKSIQTTASRYLSAERVQARVADAAALLN